MALSLTFSFFFGTLFLPALNAYQVSYSPPKPPGTVYFPGRYDDRRSLSNCDSLVKSKEGWIFTPNYPSNYDNSLTCTFTVKRLSDDVCKIQIAFNDFDLEDSSPTCDKDYLDIGDGVRMCGILLPETKKTISFPSGHSTLALVFKSDGRRNRKGFMAQIKQLPNSCSGHEGHGHRNPNNQNDNSDRSYPFKPLLPPAKDFNGFGKKGERREFCDSFIGGYRGTLKSPGHPYQYKPNSMCIYTIQRPSYDVCRVELRLKQFDVASNPFGSPSECNSDFLELPDRSRLCGYRTDQRTLFYTPGSDYLILSFQSDSSGSSPGFEIDVHQISSSCGYRPAKVEKCDQLIRGETARIRSPGFPQPYASQQQCVYMIEPTDRTMCYFALEFLNFDLESNNGLECSKDFLQLPDGNRICGTFAGKKTYLFPREKSRIAMFYFSTDGYQSRTGFDIALRQIPCGSVGPDRDMRPTQPSLQPGSRPGSRPGSGSVLCDRLITDPLDVITSPLYPQDYSPLTRCVYTIYRSSSDVCQTRLQFLNFDVEKTVDCRSDYVLIESTGEKLCGRQIITPQKVLKFPENQQIRLIFNSDGQVSRPGFEIKIEQLKDSCYKPVTARPSRDDNGNGLGANICNVSSTVYDIIRSPNYPRNYDPNTDCTYRIYRNNKAVCGLEIGMTEFSVGTWENKRCINDYLEVEGVRYCGFRKGEKLLLNFPAEKEEVDLKFKTDHYQNYAGFLLETKQVSTQCRNQRQPVKPAVSPTSCGEESFRGKSFQILSPGYEAGAYPAFSDCHYRIRKVNYEVCAIEVKFIAFHVEDSEDCSKDHLQIGDIKVCGKLPYQTVRTYEFGEDELVLKFHADGDGQEVGYFIDIQQITC